MKKVYVALLGQFILIPTLLSAQWQLRYPSVAPSSITDIVFVSDRVGFCSTIDAAIYRTTDRGVTWMELVRKERKCIHSIVFSDTLNGVAVLPVQLYWGYTKHIADFRWRGNVDRTIYCGIQ